MPNFVQPGACGVQKNTERAVLSVNWWVEHRYQYSVQSRMMFMVPKNHLNETGGYLA